MRAMILAAGRGERMGTLTASCPKPLLRVAGKYLIEYAIDNLKTAGIVDIVINVSYQAEQIKFALGNGSRYGVHIQYSEEKERLETGGGVFQALRLLGSEPFIVMSSDIISDYPIALLPKEPTGLAHLVLIDNPSFHPQGDFGLYDGKVGMLITPRLTFANIGVYRPALFAECKPGHFTLNRLLFAAIENQQVTGEYFQGNWFNVGTPAQLREVESAYSSI